jgi:hypothetical protein
MSFQTDRTSPAGTPDAVRPDEAHVDGLRTDVPGGRADPTAGESFVLRGVLDQFNGGLRGTDPVSIGSGAHGPVSLTDVSRRTKPALARTGAVRGESEMYETQSSSPPRPIPPVEVTDYVGMGSVVADWSTGQRPLPRDVRELRHQLDGIARVSDRVTELEFVQGTPEKLVIRLPVREMIEESIDAMTDPMAEGRYPLPQFYDDYHKPGLAPIMTPIDILFARVGDYTIAQCK